MLECMHVVHTIVFTSSPTAHRRSHSAAARAALSSGEPTTQAPPSRRSAFQRCMCPNHATRRDSSCATTGAASHPLPSARCRRRHDVFAARFVCIEYVEVSRVLIDAVHNPTLPPRNGRGQKFQLQDCAYSWRCPLSHGPRRTSTSLTSIYR